VKLPEQIDGVVGVDRMDTHDRQKLDPSIKLQLLCAEARETHGRDPRSGGFVIVGRPRVLLQLMVDMTVSGKASEIRLERPIVLGTDENGADRLGWWHDIPIVARSAVANDRLWVIKVDMLPVSSKADRSQMGRLRIHAHAGRLEELRG
jgi:hypothetical protein